MMTIRSIVGLAACCCLLISRGYCGDVSAPVCLDPTPWSCGNPPVANIGFETCASNGGCFQVQGGNVICSDTNFDIRGGSYNQGPFTAGGEPSGNGTEVTGGTYRVCVWQVFCWEECEPIPGGAGHECSGSYLPSIPWGGFDLTFGNACP